PAGSARGSARRRENAAFRHCRRRRRARPVADQDGGGHGAGIGRRGLRAALARGPRPSSRNAMMLLVDAGNTRIKLDWLKAGSACRAGRVHAFTLDEPETARDWLSALPARPSRALGVNVAGEPAALMLGSLLRPPVGWAKAGASALGVPTGHRGPAGPGAPPTGAGRGP